MVTKKQIWRRSKRKKKRCEEKWRDDDDVRGREGKGETVGEKTGK